MKFSLHTAFFGTHSRWRLLALQEQWGEPVWVDWELVKRGQEVWLEHWGGWIVGLSVALLVGFSIGRFSEVLFHSGYAQDALTATNRYSDTAFAMLDWFSYDLSCPGSRARVSIYTVRKMHAYARRRAKDIVLAPGRKLFDKDHGEGVPLSQYDMAQVLLAFSGIVIMIMEADLGVPPIPRGDLEAMVHCIRLIGWHLGILDEFNPCASLEECER